MTVTTLDGPVSRKIGGSEAKLIFASSLGTVFEWYDFYLYGSLATIISKQFFSGVNETAGFHLRPSRLRRRLRGSAFRCAHLRPSRRHGRPEVHLPRDDRDHGIVDLRGRTSPDLPDDRRGGACDPHRAATSARPRARRRIRRSGDLRRGAFASGQARPLHFLDPDDSDAGILPVAAGDPRRPSRDRRSRVRGVGLARSLPDVDRAARRFGLDPAVAHRVPALPKDEGRRKEDRRLRSPKLSDSGPMPRSSSSLFSASSPARRSSGTPGSSTRCSS